MSKVRVMIVDDNFRFATAAAEFLSANEGLEVLASASSGKEALQRVAAERPDLVITDLFMPEMSGIELSRRLKRRHPELRVVVVSLDAGAESADQALLAGAEKFLAKDSFATDLIPCIEQLFGLRTRANRPTAGVSE